MSFKELAEKNFTIFFLSTLLSGFLAGFGCYEAILRISNQEKIGAERLQALERIEEQSNSQKIQEKIKENGIKVHIIDEAYKVENAQDRNAKSRVSQLLEDLKVVVPSAVDSKFTNKDKIEGFEANNIDSNVHVVIMHRHAFEKESDSIALLCLKNYLQKNPTAKYLIYSSTFEPDPERKAYQKKLDKIGLKNVPLIYYPYLSSSNKNAQLQQQAARLTIIMELLKFKPH